ncbi:MAG: HAMP domain-containing sensor histidine kinase [Burkholderiaceae bacterium]
MSRKLPSLKRYLWNWAAGALVIVWITLAAAAWNSGHHEARELTDGKLISVARLLLAPRDQASLDTPANRATHHRDYAVALAVLRWRDGQLVEDSHDLAPRLRLSQLPAPGLQTVGYDDNGSRREWRMYVADDEAGNRTGVLVDVRERTNLGHDLAEHIVLPVLLVLPVVMLVLWLAIRRGLHPLDRLSEDVARLDTAAGHRLDGDHRFREFASSVHAINQLVDSLHEQVRRERAFASDVAHELRTPLTSLALGASAARQSPTPDALARLEGDALRAGRILQQLLDLARAERDAPNQLDQAVDLGATATSIIEVHAPQAYQLGHELALQQPEAPVHVHVIPTLLELALRNLVDNAIRHTPPDTQIQVDVWSDAHGVGVAVSDDGGRSSSGPRVAADGLGLGLRLVGRLAEAMGARLETGQAQAPMTTRYALVWPRDAMPTNKQTAP